MNKARQPECYSVVIAGQVLQDTPSNNFSFINIIESIGVPEPMLGKTFPVEVHSCWKFPQEFVGQLVEVRVEVATRCGDETLYSNPAKVLVFSDGDTSKADVGGHVRAQGLPLPSAFGEYLVRMNWRFSDSDEWSIGAAYWFLTITDLPLTGPVESPAQSD